ncbi:MAG: YjjG family noncanonical pyrimidine nucleotidase [Bacteroidia bacterium]|nr:YjjG family noncanonical pyrimidine nucleotidase [Bacteroidia bacterium]MBT8269561.1 YjjG family noncanonical pyrimidine nucleotidase [Bacteroidia bacterium]NNF81614.1 noncanonical pyrimidine nucleotidase, YjjG family [Flavobacteriaceae bacterium]NNK71140.1 noncanonical pyrimidine nucleotidase, YjjG family [Flavobacteriaceae bacterium]NNL79415.1 noncanonical pyrimidine nucleotidase, YjjG family [Flavobacteriaceae bacterium]
MLNNGIKHVFFDLDHTLWDFDKNSALTFEKIFQMNDIRLDLDGFLKIYEPLNLAYWKLYREDKIDKPSLRFHRLNDTFQKMEMKVKAAMIHRLAEDYIAHLTSFNHLFEGTFEILEYLMPKYQMHIITNGFKEVQHGKLNKAGIDHYFQTVTNSEMVGAKKPSPKIFNHALDRAGARANQSIMIGDNYEADILGALDQGLDAICFNYHNESIENGIKTVDNLIEIKNYL